MIRSLKVKALTWYRMRNFCFVALCTQGAVVMGSMVKIDHLTPRIAKDEADRQAKGIDYGVDFGAEPASGSAKSLGLSADHGRIDRQSLDIGIIRYTLSTRQPSAAS